MQSKRERSKAVLARLHEQSTSEKNDATIDFEKKLKALIKEFINANPSAYKRQLLDEMNSGAPLTGVTGIRRKLAACDVEFFGRAYVPHYFTRSSPSFHRELDAMWTQSVMKGLIPADRETAAAINRMKGNRRALAAPRGHAKSTTLTFKDPLHAVCYGYKRYIILLSDTYDQAAGFLSSIKEELEENEAIITDFGNLTGDIWRENVIVTKSKIKVEAIGAGQKIRGRKHKNWRPDLIILDDIENDKNVVTPDQRKKLKSWFDKAVSKAGDDYTDIIMIGTILHYASLLSNTLRNPDYDSKKYKAVISFSKEYELWKQWEEIFIELDNERHKEDALAFFEEHKPRMLEGTGVLWEEKLSYYDLMRERVSGGEAAFNSEYQNEPINPDDCLFQEEWFDYYDESAIDFKSGEYLFFGFIDPSLGKTKRSDYSVILTLAKSKKSGYMYVLDADLERRHPDKIITDVLEKERWLRKTFGRGYTKFGAETNQFQWFLKEELAKASARAGLYLPIVEVQQTTDKIMRIQSLQPDIKNKYIKFNVRHKLLLEQLRNFPMDAHDDGADALEGCRTIAKKAKRFTIIDRSQLGI